MTHIFCKCGYLPPTWHQYKHEERLGSVPIQRREGTSTDAERIARQYCWAVGYRWGWDITRCPKDPEQTIQGVPLCKRHARIAACLLPHNPGAVRQRWEERVARYDKMPVQITDGGRSQAGFEHSRGDCVYRAIAIAMQRPYREVAEALFSLGADRRRNGVPGFIYEPYLLKAGWRKLKAPAGTFLRRGMLPVGRLLVHVSRHLLTVIDGTIHDSYDSSEHGTRRVLYYYSKEAV